LRETLRDFGKGVMFCEFKVGRDVEAPTRADEITRGYETGEPFAGYPEARHFTRSQNLRASEGEHFMASILHGVKDTMRS
jgi:hypothetical protein